jgi:hypothetical protein
MATARDLLTEALGHLSAMPHQMGSVHELCLQIGEFLDQPVHIGDTIALHAHYPKREEYAEPTTELGYTFQQCVSKNRVYDFETSSYTGEIEDYKFTRTVYPEAGPTRQYEWSALREGIVVPINGRNYRVQISIDSDDGIPGGATVTFTRTDDEETPFESFDLEAAVAKQITYWQGEITEAKAEIEEIKRTNRQSEWFNEAHYESQIARAECRIANLENGSEVPWPGGDVTFFGQPRFIQNEMSPAHNGRAGMCLASLNTEWGDAGNVNILFACDDNGVPCRAWFEASCH